MIVLLNPNLTDNIFTNEDIGLNVITSYIIIAYLILYAPKIFLIINSLPIEKKFKPTLFIFF
jgi:hypothetical protein